MGTMAMFWDADPLKGGRPYGWFGMDGHPSNFGALARATDAEEFGREVRTFAAGKAAHTWIEPKPGCWAYWPGAGLFVMDYGYWFDADLGMTMVLNYQSAAVPFLPGMECDHETWPRCYRDGVDQTRRGVLLPELHATVSPDAIGDFHRHTVSRAPLDLLLEAALRDGKGIVVRRKPQDPAPGTAPKGLWAPEGSDGGFEIEDTGGSNRVEHRLLAEATGTARDRMGLRLHANGDAFRCFKRYSTEALLDEAPGGAATISAAEGRFRIELADPGAGTVAMEGDSLPHLVLEVRRALHAAPGFELADPPPHR